MADRPASQRHLSSLETAGLVRTARRVAGFDLGQRPTFATAANVSGVRTKTLTFSQRRDSLTIFALDEHYGTGSKAGAWIGPNEKVIAACRRVLLAAKIPATEIARVRVISERGMVAERLSADEVRFEKPQLLRKLARAERRVAGLPVWSSHAVIGLTSAGKVGSVEIHWPHLTPAAISEAKILAALVKRGFKPGDVAGAQLETVEAGFIHSPAIGFFMDVTAAIRCIYAPDEPTVGRKPVLYLDRHGELVALPRDVTPAKPSEGPRKRKG
jgi:hypothetical protein